MLFNFILIFGIVLMCFGLYNVKHIKDYSNLDTYSNQ